MQFSTLQEFDSEFAGLSRKWRHLSDDIERLKRVLEQEPRDNPPAIVIISGTGVQAEIYKVKHFRSTDMKGKGSRSGIRIVYAFLPAEDRLEFVEIYCKDKDDTDCDKERIKRPY